MVRAAWRATFGQRRTLTLALLVLLVVFTIGFSSSFWLPLRLAYLLFFGIVTAGVWRLLALRGLDAEVQRPPARVYQGQALTEFLVLRNRWRLPRMWLELEEQSDLPGHLKKHVVRLAGKAWRNWRVDTLCRRRGFYTLGPITVRGGDPLGLFTAQRRFGQPHHVLVYPRTLDLPGYTAPPASLPGEGRFRRPTYYITPNAAGLREYAPGDSVKRIHWPSTLRTGALMVKTFELDPVSDFWIVVDLQGSEHSGAGDDASVEMAVTVGASLARHFLAQNRSVGLLLFDTALRRVEADRGPQQLSRILETLALAQPVGDVPLATLLNQQSSAWGRHTTVITVSAATDPRWVRSLRALMREGVPAAAVVLDLESFGGRPGADAVVADLRLAGIGAHRLARGDDIAAVLAQRAPVGGRAAAIGAGR